MILHDFDRWAKLPVVKEIGVPMVIEACSHPKIRELSGKGGNWDFLNTFPIGQPYIVSYDMNFPYSVCAGFQDNGSWCPRVEAAAYQGTWKNLVMWTASCGAINPPRRTLAGT